MSNQFNRRSFLRNTAATGLGVALGGVALGARSAPLIKTSTAAITTKPKDLIRVGFVGIGNMGTGHVNNLLKIEGCQVAAVCDIRPERTDWAKKAVVAAGQPEPKVYGKDENDYKRMCANEDLDLVYNAAPWRYHTPICLEAMKNGKHAASEVNIGLSVDELWSLVETSEKTQKHCIMQENCCYDRDEMAVMNMVKKGLFGELLHGECGYLHDLRSMLISPTYYQGMWRWHQEVTRDGSLYPTHGIGPMGWCMDINRGDALDYLVSFSSNARGLHEYAVDKLGADHELSKTKVACGDVNTVLIKTKLGKTIICKHDTHLPRPYSRDFLVQGTKGIMRKYPTAKVHIEGVSKGHGWQDFRKEMRGEYDHPVWKEMQDKAKGAGHGGMDFIEDYRLIQAMRKGITPDIDVYDSVVWSSLITLSEESVANGSKPVKIPDFTRGMWKQPRKLGIDQWHI